MQSYNMLTNANRKCPLCDDETEPLQVVRDCNGKETTLNMCYNCGALSNPDRELLNNDDELHRQLIKHEQHWEYTPDKELAELRDRSINLARRLLSHVGDEATSISVCELGVGRGGLLAAFKQLGCQVSGCEPSAALVNNARRVLNLSSEELRNLTLEEHVDALEEEGKKFDVIVLWHVLEHVHNPIKQFATISRIAKSEARIFIELPLGYSEHIFPEHMFYATPATMHWLAKHNGYYIEKIEIISEMKFIRAVVKIGKQTEDKTKDSIKKMTEISKVNIFDISQYIINDLNDKIKRIFFKKN